MCKKIIVLLALATSSLAFADDAFMPFMGNYAKVGPARVTMAGLGQCGDQDFWDKVTIFTIGQFQAYNNGYFTSDYWNISTKEGPVYIPAQGAMYPFSYSNGPNDNYVARIMPLQLQYARVINGAEYEYYQSLPLAKDDGPAGNHVLIAKVGDLYRVQIKYWMEELDDSGSCTVDMQVKKQ